MMEKMSAVTLPDLGKRKLVAIVFTDMVSFSAMVGRSEEKTLRRLQHHFKRMREFAVQWRGHVVKSMGDGLLIYFGNVADAVSWALDVQNRISAGNLTLPEGDRIQHRIGIHWGDVFFKEGDLLGEGVNIAARLQGEADAGGICISQNAYDVVKTKMNVHANFIGERELKNIRDAVPVYQIVVNAKPTAEGEDDLSAPKKDLSLEERARIKTKWIVAGFILLFILDAIFIFAWFYHPKKKVVSMPNLEPIPTVMPVSNSAPASEPAKNSEEKK